MKKYLISTLVMLIMGFSANAQTTLITESKMGSGAKAKKTLIKESKTKSDANEKRALTKETNNGFQEWAIVGEIGYGFLEDKTWAYKATIGANYSFTDKFYVQGQIGYNSSNCNKLIKTGKYSYVDYEMNAHFITLPFEVGYRITTEDRLWGLIPFAGLGFNIGLGGKSKYDNMKDDLEIGGKLGVEARAGLHVRLYGFQITGSYHLPINSKQEDFFGEDAYPELSIGFEI